MKDLLTKEQKKELERLIKELTEEAKKGLIMRMEINLHKLKLNYYNTKED